MLSIARGMADATVAFPVVLGAYTIEGMADPQGDYVQGMRSSVVGMSVNAGLAMIKLLAGVMGHSYALIADAVESMADILSSAIVWGGLRIAALPADQGHPYGHGKAEPLAALTVSVMLFMAGVGIAVQSIRDLVGGQHHMPAGFTLLVLLVVVAFKEGLFQFVRRIGTRTGSSAVVADAWHHRSDAITSAAAAIGISVALLWGYAAADDWAALVASGVILFNAWRLSRQPLHELMDAEPTHISEQARLVASRVQGVRDIEKVFARKSGMRHWVDMHVEVDPGMTVRDAHALAHDVKEAIRAEMPSVQDVLIHVEPHNAKADVPAATH